jgi:hypothetical protein
MALRITGFESAGHQVPDHGTQFIQVPRLRGHLGFVAGRDQPALILLNREHQFFHAVIVAVVCRPIKPIHKAFRQGAVRQDCSPFVFSAGLNQFVYSLPLGSGHGALINTPL